MVKITRDIIERFKVNIGLGRKACVLFYHRLRWFPLNVVKWCLNILLILCCRSSTNIFSYGGATVVFLSALFLLLSYEILRFYCHSFNDVFIHLNVTSLDLGTICETIMIQSAYIAMTQFVFVTTRDLFFYIKCSIQ